MISMVIGLRCALLARQRRPYIGTAGRETPTVRKPLPARANRRRKCNNLLATCGNHRSRAESGNRRRHASTGIKPTLPTLTLSGVKKCVCTNGPVESIWCSRADANERARSLLACILRLPVGDALTTQSSPREK
jgi:hypothetical protein